MNIPRALVVALACAALAAGPTAAGADPGNGHGKGKGHDQGSAEHGQGHGNSRGGGKQGNWQGGPSIDRGDVLGILSGHRDYWRPGPALPPGIQKNLARGKPLPPGIARKLDGRLLGQLPHYDGYEWRQAGTDLILVTVATGLIYEVLSGVLD
ncbi:MAG: anti-virulence regulator CigR family protein [Pseudomonas piscis]|uniref:anti-virulence regulator CigR family protein n=1 Tax=Pseudomonas piscis TaxID=2614538 RepID=UPI003D291217